MGEAHALWHLADLPSVSREDSVTYLRSGIDLLHDGAGPQVLNRLKLFLASELMWEEGSYAPTIEVFREMEALLRDTIADMLASGWTSHIPGAANYLWKALMALSKPREALAVVQDALPYARANPIESVFLHLLAAEAALACDEPTTAAQACGDFKAEVDYLGRDHFVTLADPIDFTPALDPFARIDRVERALGQTPVD